MSSDLRYLFPAKNHVLFVDTLCMRKSSNFNPSIKRINKVKKHNKIILHLHVINPRLYKRSRNQAVVMFQTVFKCTQYTCMRASKTSKSQSVLICSCTLEIQSVCMRFRISVNIRQIIFLEALTRIICKF